MPSNTNFRALCSEFWDVAKSEDFRFGLEQEYLILQGKQQYDLDPETVHYCSQSSTMKLGRQLAQKHLSYCLKAGLDICGTNSEVLED